MRNLFFLIAVPLLVLSALYHYHKNTIHAALELLAASGRRSLEEISADMFMKGDEFEYLENKYFPDILTPYAEQA